MKNKDMSTSDASRIPKTPLQVATDRNFKARLSYLFRGTRSVQAQRIVMLRVRWTSQTGRRRAELRLQTVTSNVTYG